MLKADLVLCLELGEVQDAGRARVQQLVDDIEGAEIDRGLLEETARRIAARRVSDEGQEGVRAFLDKRKPGWAQ